MWVPSLRERDQGPPIALASAELSEDAARPTSAQHAVPGVQVSLRTEPHRSPARPRVSPVLQEDKGSLEPSLPPTTSQWTSRAPVPQAPADSSYKESLNRKAGGKTPAMPRADIHIIGEVAGASGFKSRQPAISCKWRLLYDRSKSWALVRGQQGGSTQCTNASVRSKWPMSTQECFVAWEHPLDIHLTTQRREGWPSLLLMVFSRDDMSERDFFISYAICPLPCSPGMHHVSCPTWYPVEPELAAGRNFFAWYMDMAPRVQDEAEDLRFLCDVKKRGESGGRRLASIGAGTVHLRLQLLFRNMTGLAVQEEPSGLHKSLENFHESIDLSRQKEMSKMAAMEEYAYNVSKRNETSGLRQVREGRERRFEAVRQALEARRSRSVEPRDTSYSGQPDQSTSSSSSSSTGRVSLSAPRERPPLLSSTHHSSRPGQPSHPQQFARQLLQQQQQQRQQQQQQQETQHAAMAAGMPAHLQPLPMAQLATVPGVGLSGGVPSHSYPHAPQQQQASPPQQGVHVPRVDLSSVGGLIQPQGIPQQQQQQQQHMAVPPHPPSLSNPSTDSPRGSRFAPQHAFMLQPPPDLAQQHHQQHHQQRQQHQHQQQFSPGPSTSAQPAGTLAPGVPHAYLAQAPPHHMQAPLQQQQHAMSGAGGQPAGRAQSAGHTAQGGIVAAGPQGDAWGGSSFEDEELEKQQSDRAKSRQERRRMYP